MSNPEKKPPDGKDPNNNVGEAENQMDVSENVSETPIQETTVSLKDAYKYFNVTPGQVDLSNANLAGLRLQEQVPGNPVLNNQGQIGFPVLGSQVGAAIQAPFLEKTQASESAVSYAQYVAKNETITHLNQINETNLKEIVARNAKRALEVDTGSGIPAMLKHFSTQGCKNDLIEEGNPSDTEWETESGKFDHCFYTS